MYGVPESKVVHRDVPDWTRDENALYRGDTRSPDEIRAAGGFDVPGPDKAPDLIKHVDGDTNAYVSTSTDQTVAKERAGLGAMYVIKAPGGIMTDATLDAMGHDRRYGESEVLFAGGVDWRYVAGWHDVRYEPGSGFVTGPFVPNPDYVGDRSPEPPRADTTTAQTTRTDTAKPTPADTTQPSPQTSASHPIGPTQPMPAGQPFAGQAPGPAHPGSMPQSRPTWPPVQAGGQKSVPRTGMAQTGPFDQSQRSRPGSTPSHTNPPGTGPTQSGSSEANRPRTNPPWAAPSPTDPTNRDQPRSDPSDRDTTRPGQADPGHQDRPPQESFGPNGTPHPDHRSPETTQPHTDHTPDRPQDRAPQREQEHPQRPQKPLSDRLGDLDDELDRNVRDHVQSTPAGMAIFERTQDKGQSYTSQALHRIRGQFVVDVHGSPDGARVGRYPLTPEDVADVIRANPDWNGDSVTLVGCETGRRDDGFAARLAQELGVPVTAPNTHAWVDYNGNLFATNTSDGENPGWPPNGEWRTFEPDGSRHISESPYPSGHTPEWGDEPADHAPLGAEARGEREDDFREMREESREKRDEGLDSVREVTGRNPMTDEERRPHERALSTARYRSDRGGEATDFYNFSGKEHDWSPAAEAPQRPPKGERLFETSYAKSYDPETGGWRDGRGSDRTHDSEPKMFEDLARHQLAEHSGLPRAEVDRALREAARLVDELAKADENHYKNGFKGEVERTRDRIELAISELNKRAEEQARTNGTTYTPFTARDISGELRMVVDLPSAKRDGTPPDFQVCLSCKKVMLAYERAFPGMRLEVVNRAGERLHPL